MTSTNKLIKRSFEALKYPKFSPERNKLNEDTATSEYQTSYKYIVETIHTVEGLNEQVRTYKTFRNKCEAEHYIKLLN